MHNCHEFELSVQEVDRYGDFSSTCRDPHNYYTGKS